MWQSQFAVYLGQENGEGFFGFLVLPTDSEEGSNFYIVLETKEGLNKETGRQVLSEIKQELLVSKIETLTDLEDFINNQVKKQNLPTGISLAAGFIVNKIIYLKTIGEGKIFIRRKKSFEKIIDGNKTASGYLEEDDFFIFTTNRFIQLFNQEMELKTVFDHKNPHQIIEDLAPQIKAIDDHGAIALFVQLISQESISQQEEKEEMIISQPMVLEKGRNFLNRLYQRFQQSRLQTDRKKTLTTGIVVVLILILFWSVGLGITRRNESVLNKKVNRSRELITQKLDQAEEVAFLNFSRSQALINEARDEFNNLKKEVGSKKKDDITRIEELIKNKEGKILKKEEKKADEFFDLTIDNKQAQGSKIYLDEDKLVIFDKNQGIIYKLSLTKKSINKVSDLEIKSARLIAGYQDNTFFYIEKKGVYKAGEESKPKIVVDADSDWGKIIDLWIYNGNIYILDTGKDEIYKYLAGEEKYSNKSSYIKSNETVNLDGATSMAIDSSVYIGFKDYLVKFTAGARDEFKTSFPEEGINLNKIYTSKNLEKVYAWDKNKGTIYVLGKNGTYERQIKSEILAKGNDLVVFDNAAYILVKEKIYKVNLD